MNRGPGDQLPDYELPDHESVPRKLSHIQGDDPLILTLARGHYCPKEHQHLELAANYPKIAVAYTNRAEQLFFERVRGRNGEPLVRRAQ